MSQYCNSRVHLAGVCLSHQLILPLSGEEYGYFIVNQSIYVKVAHASMKTGETLYKNEERLRWVDNVDDSSLRASDSRYEARIVGRIFNSKNFEKRDPFGCNKRYPICCAG